MANTIENNPGAIDAQIRTTEKRLNNLLDLAGDAGDRALLPKIHELQATLSTLREQKTAWAERNSLKRRLLQIRENDIRRMITANAMLLRGSSNVRGAADPDGHPAGDDRLYRERQASKRGTAPRVDYAHRSDRTPGAEVAGKQPRF
jgi:hypothetical protein